jgi:hypothetical protein
MSIDQVKQSLQTLGNAIEQIAKTPAPSPEIADRSLSGNKINGGMITNFNSVGICDSVHYPNEQVLVITDDKITVPAIKTGAIVGDTKVLGSLNVEGEITAQRLSVNEINADIRNERTSNLEFKGENGNAPFNKGLIWTGNGPTRQFTYQDGHLFSSESINVLRDKEYQINGSTVLTGNELGASVVKSNLRTVGTLQTLKVSGDVSLGGFVFWDNESQRLGLGIENPNGALSIASIDHEFIVDYGDREFNVGTYTTSKLNLVTDNTPRITIGSEGNIVLHKKVSIKGSLGIGVTNFQEDVSITTAGPIRLQGKKQEVGDSLPTGGNYSKGDIIWNTNPIPTGYIGWVCIREGTPGEWKQFGLIAS